MRILHLRPTPLIVGMVFGLALIGASSTSAQVLSADEQAIHDVVVRFHGALAAGDSATIAELLAPDSQPSWPQREMRRTDLTKSDLGE